MKKEVVSIRKRIPYYKNLVPEYQKWDNSVPSRWELRVSVKIGIIYTLGVTLVGGTGGGIEIRNKANSAVLTANGSSVVGEKILQVTATEDEFIIRWYGADVMFYKNFILREGSYSTIEYFPQDNGRIVERMKDNGEVQELRIRFYPGVERTLQVRPYIQHKGRRQEDFFTYPENTERFITGDDDYLTFTLSSDFEYDDELVIEYENVGDYIYTLAVDVIVRYFDIEVAKSEQT